jgi:hypothetical protein
MNHSPKCESHGPLLENHDAANVRLPGSQYFYPTLLKLFRVNWKTTPIRIPLCYLPLVDPREAKRIYR